MEVLLVLESLIFGKKWLFEGEILAPRRDETLQFGHAVI